MNSFDFDKNLNHQESMLLFNVLIQYMSAFEEIKLFDKNDYELAVLSIFNVSRTLLDNHDAVQRSFHYLSNLPRIMPSPSEKWKKCLHDA